MRSFIPVISFILTSCLGINNTAYAQSQLLAKEINNPTTNIQASAGILYLNQDYIHFDSKFFSIGINRTILGLKKNSRHIVEFGVNGGGYTFGKDSRSDENYYFASAHLTYYINSPRGGFEMELGAVFPLNYPKTVSDGGYSKTRYTEIPVMKFGFRVPLSNTNQFFRMGFGYPTGFYAGLGLGL